MATVNSPLFNNSKNDKILQLNFLLLGIVFFVKKNWENIPVVIYLVVSSLFSTEATKNKGIDG